VHGHAQELEDRAFPRESALLLVEPGAAPEQVHDVLGVAAVEDREAGRQPDRAAVTAEHRVREGVERAAGDVLARRADENGAAPVSAERSPPVWVSFSVSFFFETATLNVPDTGAFRLLTDFRPVTT